MHVDINVRNCKLHTDVSFCTLNLKHLKKKGLLDLFRSTTRKRNITAKLAQPHSWTGANSSKRKTRQIGEGNNQTLSAVACVVHTYKVLRYERKRVKNNSFFVDVMIEKTVLSVKKAKEWKKKIIIED